MSFGPGPEQWLGETTGLERTTLEDLASVGQAGLTDLDLMKVGEHTPDIIPLEDPGGRRVGSVKNVHFNQSRNVLVGEVTSTHTHTTEQLTTEFAIDKSKIIKVVLIK